MEGKKNVEDTWAWKEGDKSHRFNVQRERETFIGVKKNFMSPRASTSTTQKKIIPLKKKPKEITKSKEVDTSILKSFLHTCMKLFRDHKFVKGLQELIDKCASTKDQQPEPCIVHKVYKHKKRTSKEMWLTTQIDDYEIDQVILDLGSDANFIPK